MLDQENMVDDAFLQIWIRSSFVGTGFVFSQCFYRREFGRPRQ